ncbi:PAS domain-containing protein [Haloarcula rubra]|uniref:PAS domain-containing protein n=1 Tax=Haloarcula rubra TaxID=2487747 RepID=UPI002E2D1FE3|nr:PAS domain-containing protein [Halomicroarcula rubra]
MSLSESAQNERQFFALSIERGGWERPSGDAFREAIGGEAFETVNDAILVFDPEDGTFVDCNVRACSLLGYDRAELLSLTLEDVHPDDMDRLNWLC